MVSVAALLYASPALAQAPNLGSAGSFAVLAGNAVTCTNSAIIGDVGVVTGALIPAPGCSVAGSIHNGNAVALQAYADFLSAYQALENTPCTQTLATFPLTPLPPGVYCFAAAATATNQTLTLTGNGVYIFKIGTTAAGALTGTNFDVVLTNGAQACNVYWWVDAAVTLTDSNFVGTILTGLDITLTDSVLRGDTLAGGSGMASVPVGPLGAVTLTRSLVNGCMPPAGNPPCPCQPHPKDNPCNNCTEHCNCCGTCQPNGHGGSNCSFCECHDDGSKK